MTAVLMPFCWAVVIAALLVVLVVAEEVSAVVVGVIPRAFAKEGAKTSPSDARLPPTDFEALSSAGDSTFLVRSTRELT